MWNMKKLIKRFLGQSSGVANPEQWLIDSFGYGNTSSSGIRINAGTALGLPAVWSSVNLIAGHIGSMPIDVRRRTGDGASTEAHNLNAYRLLNLEPNEYHTPFIFKQTLMAHALLTGNGRAYIARNNLGQPTELILLHPEHTYTIMLGGVKWHVVWLDPNYVSQQLPFGAGVQSGTLPDGRGGMYNFPDSEVLHIPGLGWNGLWGHSLLHVAKNAFGLDAAGLDAAGYVFRNNGQPNMVLQAPRGLFTTYKEADEFLRWFRKGHTGVSNAAKVALLRDGITAQTLPLNASDQQYLETRGFSREDVALLFGTEYLMGESSAVYKDLAERQSAYVINTLSKWISTWEQECRRKLLSRQQFTSDSHYFKFLSADLMRGAPNSLADYTGKLRQQGVISGNEAREIHGMNPVDGLDDYSNPNITTPDDTATETDREPEAESENDQTREIAARAIASNFAAFIKHERRRVLELAKHPEDFLDRCDSFYDSFHIQLVTACRECGIDEQAGADHCATSRRLILETAGVAFPEDLYKTIRALVADWESRSEEFARCSTLT